MRQQGALFDFSDFSIVPRILISHHLHFNRRYRPAIQAPSGQGSKPYDTSTVKPRAMWSGSQDMKDKIRGLVGEVFLG